MKHLFTIILPAILILLNIQPGRAQISIDNLGTTYLQSFDTLSNSGTGTKMPTHWYFSEQGSNGNTSYTADDGSTNKGDTYSYGSTSGTDRALGTLADNNNVCRFGTAFTNNTGAAITDVKIEFTVEQWRLGATGRQDSSRCELSIFASSIDLGFYQAAPQLNLMSPVTSGTTGALNGNNSANRNTITYTISGFSIPDGTTVWIRWTDVNISGDDDALAIDDFKITVDGPIPDVTVGFATPNMTVKEDVDSFMTKLYINDPNSNPTSVSIYVDASSTAGVDDYTYTGQTYTFPANSKDSIPVWIKITDDKIIEGDEYLYLLLYNATNGAQVKNGILEVRIRDNDTTETFKLREMKFPQVAGVPDTTRYGFAHGVVTSGQFTKNGLRFFMSDSTGNIEVRGDAAANLSYSPAAGDSVLIRGKVQSENFQAYILADSIYKKSAGHALPEAKTFTNPDDSLESGRVKVAKLEWNGATPWDTTGAHTSGGFMVTAEGESGKTYSIFISNNSDLFNKPRPKYLFNLTGILIQEGKTANSGYYIWPETAAHIEEVPLPLYSISQVTTNNTNGVADSIGVLCWLKGEVQSPSYNAAGFDFTLIDKTGGINLHTSAKISGYTLAMGDSIRVRGRIGQFNGLTRMEADSIIRLSGGHNTITSVAVTELNESTESELIVLKGVQIVPADTLKWQALGSGFTVRVYNGNGDTVQVRIDNDIDLFNEPRPEGTMNITGIGSQFDNSLPYLQGYYLLPRNKTDIVITEPPVYARTIAEVRPINADGVALHAGTRFWLKGVVHSGNFSLDGLWFSLRDHTGAISISSASVINSYAPEVNDSIAVRGTLGQVNGLTILVPDSIHVLQQGLANAPVLVTALGENTESDLVRIEDLRLVDAAEWDTTSSFNKEAFVVRAYNADNDTFRIRVSRATGLYFEPAPSGDRLHITGIGSQDDATLPYTGGYLLMPRSAADVEELSGLEDAPEENMVEIYPNPAINILNINLQESGAWLSLTDMKGCTIKEARITGSTTAWDISALPAGVYMVRAVTGSGVFASRFIKQ